MKIYVLIYKHFAVSEIVLVDTNIKEIKKKISDMCKKHEYPEVQVWENGKLIDKAEGNDALKLLAHEQLWIQDFIKKRRNKL